MQHLADEYEVIAAAYTIFQEVTFYERNVMDPGLADYIFGNGDSRGEIKERD